MVEKRAKRPLPERKSGEGKKRERKVDRQNVTDKEKRKKKYQPKEKIPEKQMVMYQPQNIETCL